MEELITYVEIPVEEETVVEENNEVVESNEEEAPVESSQE